MWVLIKIKSEAFIPLRRVVICQSLLKALSESQTSSAMGELCKMAMIQGGDFYQQFKKTKIGASKTFGTLFPKPSKLNTTSLNKTPGKKRGFGKN